MTDTTAASRDLASLKVAELQALASRMGMSGTGKMRKAELVDAIRSRGERGPGAADSSRTQPRADQGGDRESRRSAIADEVAAARPSEQAAAHVPPAPEAAPRTDQDGAARTDQDGAARTDQDGAAHDSAETPRSRRSRRAGAPAGAAAPRQGEPTPGGEAPASAAEPHVPPVPEQAGSDADRRDDRAADRGEQRADRRDEREERQGGDQRGERREGDGQGRRRDRRDRRDRGQGEGQNGGDDRRDNDRRDNQGGYGDEESEGGRRRRNRNRGRDRKRGRDRQQGGQTMDEPDTNYSDEDVLVPVAGILDVLDQYAFLRTSGYLPGANDVYVPLNMVKRNGLRKGDAVTGAVKARDEDVENPTVQNRRNAAKFNALVRVDTVNGMQPDEARRRVDFNSLTPLYPQERLRLETDSKNYTTRIIDLVAPIGKGQRGLIVSPAKAGKTMIMQHIANAITKNNPEVHLMVVLVDERPEEVTDFERSVRGEVISSTFDRPASDHTIVAELAIERAKRLVELGRDVVVLLDGITRLGRAYNLAAPASGRILSGGVDSAALYPPKKFFGAARNIENGGSLTILATALVESGSKMDEVIFEEFKGTGNMELRLSRQLAERRTFPAIDVNASGTRREEILLGGDELKIMWKLRRLLSALDPQQSLELLLSQMKKTTHNYEFLVQVQQSASIKMEDEG